MSGIKVSAGPLCLRWVAPGNFWLPLAARSITPISAFILVGVPPSSYKDTGPWI